MEKLQGKMESPFIIEMKNVTKIFDGTTVIDKMDLNIRKGPGTNYAKTGKYTGVGVFTIVEESAGAGSDQGWGLLKSYQSGRNGWVSLDYCKRV